MILEPTSIKIADPSMRKRVGLGDAVAAAIKPVVRIIDKATMSELASCSQCAKRQEALNKMIPDIKNPFNV